MATRVLLACSSVEFQVLFVWVPLPELLAQEVQFYPQSRVFLRHHANAVGSFNFFSATFLQGFLPIRSQLYYDSGKEYRKYVPTLTLATHLFRAHTGLLHQGNHRVSFLVPFQLYNYQDRNSK